VDLERAAGEVSIKTFGKPAGVGYIAAPVSRTLAWLLFLAALPCAGVELQGNARVWAGLGFDSNSRRDYVSPGVPTVPDGFGFGLGQLQGSAQFGELFRVLGAYDLAGRKFLFQGSEDTVVQSAQLEALLAPKKWLELGVVGRARDRRGAERDYSDLQGGAQVDFVPDPALDVRLSVVAHRFIYWDRFDASWWGPDAQLTARYRFTRRHSLSVYGQFNPRTYNANATPRPSTDGTPPPPPEVRSDVFLGAGLTYTYRGPFHFSLSYGYFDLTSNSWGETIRRHRLTATGAVHLPLDFTVLGAGTLQLSSFPDGVYLSPELTVIEDDENSSSVSVKVVRPIAEHFELDARYAFYVNVLPTNQFLYLRHVVSVGVAFTW
jgi:hypothetical protein